MKIKYWGTSASEGVPGIFCSCEVCKKARQFGGRKVRTRSQLCIDEKILIDFNADTYMHSLKYGVDLSKLHSVLITHIHGDHYYPNEFLNRRVSFAHGEEIDIPLTVYGSSAIEDNYYSTISESARFLIDQNRLNFKFLTPGNRYEIEGYEVFPLPANHGTYKPLVYVIRRNGKTFSYLNDTGFPRDEFFEMLKKLQKEYGLRFDAVSYDCTSCNYDWGYNSTHMGLVKNAELRDRFNQMGLTDDKTIHIVNHFSHNPTGSDYDDMVKSAGEIGFIVSYDGMEVEL